MKHTLKHIIAMMLTLTIALTGISLNGTITANAATASDQFKDNGTITMKPGDTKKMLVIGTSRKGEKNANIMDEYKWYSSDDSIVEANSEFVSQQNLESCLELVAIKNGTATITGKPKYGHNGWHSLTMTVTVKPAVSTAAQKKCKHFWKTTAKATCERTGVKICKKCKLQQEIKKKSHKWETVTYVQPKIYTLYGCNANDIDDPSSICGATFTTEEYGSHEAAIDALGKHMREVHKLIAFGDFAFEYSADETRSEGYETIKTKVTRCKTCGLEKDVKIIN